MRGRDTHPEFALYADEDLAKACDLAHWLFRSGNHKQIHAPIYNLFMIETLYKTPTPEKGKSEATFLFSPLVRRVPAGSMRSWKITGNGMTSCNGWFTGFIPSTRTSN